MPENHTSHDHDHDHHHEHGHGHAHSHHAHHGHSHGPGGHHHVTPPAGFDKAFAWGSFLNAGFIVAEIIFGILASSVALLADAAHNIGDVLGLLLAWWAAWLARRNPTRSRTYGYGRSTIMASLTNAVVLLVGVGIITVEAINRLIEGAPASGLHSGTIMIVAAIGIVINGGTALLFARGQHQDLNIKGAYLHMMADAMVSAGVVVSGFIIMQTGWAWVDPVVSLIIAAIILVSTWGLLWQSLNLAMDKVPEHVDAEQIQQFLVFQSGVTQVHDLHIWPLSTTETALTAHLVRPASGTDDHFLQDISEKLQQQFGISHATFQIEEGDARHPCMLAGHVA